MRFVFTILFFIFFIDSIFPQEINFDDYFLPKTMRLDYNQAGNKDSSTFYFEQIKEEPFWGGSHKNLLDIFKYGDYFFYVYDSISGNLIYSRGYSSLFKEWQDTKEAITLNRSFYESIVFPFPKKSVKVVINARLKNNTYKKKFEMFINPEDYFIAKNLVYNFKVENIQNSGDPSKKLDIVIVSEGYKRTEMKKFKEDAIRFMGYFFKVTPFKENQDKVNFWIIKAPSVEDGTDLPGRNIWRNTILDSHFYTFNSDRYLTTGNIKTLRDLAALAPYDQIFILVNSEKYGGGAIYNFYNLCTSDNEYSEFVFTHEFGHGFGFLADEYAYEDETNNETLDLKVEPINPNITTLVDFAKKWDKFVELTTPIPTPEKPEYFNKIGAFEGANYITKGVYRPVYNCKMRSNDVNYFCPICQQALLRMLLFYSE